MIGSPAVYCSTDLLFQSEAALAFIFESLSVYQKAVDFADQIAELTASFPRGYYFLTEQFNRATVSIATSLAEGNGRFTKPDRKTFFTIACGSVQECVPLIEVSRRRGFVTDSISAELRDNLEEISRMLSGLIKGRARRTM